MKSIQTSSRAGFTLIEILVVVSIIAILASLAVPTANVVMRHAKETQARALIAGLIAGVKSYQTEYNRFPDPTYNGTAGSGYTADQAYAVDGSNNDLLGILHPDQTQPPTQASGNPRRIDFYDPPPAKNGANGTYSAGGSAPFSLNDSWSSPAYSQPINVAIDYGGDGAIDSSKDPTHTATQPIPTTVIAWSPGQPVNTNTANDGSDPVGKKYFVCSWK
jgi:prepilin-type N-terminal cleavage/methylation domain-containing protein